MGVARSTRDFSARAARVRLRVPIPAMPQSPAITWRPQRPVKLNEIVACQRDVAFGVARGRSVTRHRTFDALQFAIGGTPANQL